MSSAPPVEHFKGTDWEECDDFILSIRKRAFWEGKQRDSAWMADFAATNFSRKALSWHSRLPEDIRQDWSKLEVALIDRWSPPDEEEEPQIRPTPAAAPSIIHSDKFNRTLHGVLKLVLGGSNANYYASFSRVLCSATSDRSKATRVRCNPMSNTILLERIDHSRPSWLAVHWFPVRPKVENGSTDYAHITCVELQTLKSTWSNSGPYRLMTCTLSSNNEVTPVWAKDDTSMLFLSTFIVPDRGSNICIAADPEAYLTKYESDKRAKLFIEPID